MKEATVPAAEFLCPRCKLSAKAEEEFCRHCGAKIGQHRHVPWWHLHRRVYDWTLAWAYRPSAAWALFILAFAESSCFPVPPDVLLMPLALGNPRKWFRYALLCSIGSVLGGMFGYFIGWALWMGISDHVFRWFSWTGLTPANFALGAEAYQKYDFWAVFIAGFTPIPYKVFTILGGVCKINFAIFVIASVASRSARFFLVAGMMRAFGPRITPFIEKYFNWLTLLFTVLLIGGFAAIKYLR